MHDDKAVSVEQECRTAVKKPWRTPVLSVVDIASGTQGWINQHPADDTTTASGHS
ncbi:hypothetical protein [Magnetospirillum gryphiswaldense]|uniref:Uncharacterized protein n=1 Tax=Magnetospirillum gryphiswaldense (strain DSM 6361 / JCM 21280 / NBRC 15271 / MSR-1) TaxID=431944 RepID=V6EX53_MAGGM|nr:hypothetical protein [Magnetospirillum gryphiswaldense]CDK97830.1 protein of unknown function [Magnetospirillum gryphiswaldense MSR-1 v2]